MSPNKEKLLEKKIDSMNQNDRIEFYIVSNYYKNRIGTRLILHSLFLSSGSVLLIIGLFILNLNSYKLILTGHLSLSISLVFLFVIFFIFFNTSRMENQMKEKVGKIIERGTSKK